jgi:hypothetical protein
MQNLIKAIFCIIILALECNAKEYQKPKSTDARVYMKSRLFNTEPAFEGSEGGTIRDGKLGFS